MVPPVPLTLDCGPTSFLDVSLCSRDNQNQIMAYWHAQYYVSIIIYRVLQRIDGCIVRRMVEMAGCE